MYDAFMHQFGRRHASAAEYDRRTQTFHENRENIETHNSQSEATHKWAIDRIYLIEIPPYRLVVSSLIIIQSSKIETSYHRSSATPRAIWLSCKVIMHRIDAILARTKSTEGVSLTVAVKMRRTKTLGDHLKMLIFMRITFRWQAINVCMCKYLQRLGSHILSRIPIFSTMFCFEFAQGESQIF